MFQFSACSRLLKSKILRSILLPVHSEVLNMDIGGAKRDRTADLLRARQALSQLSYSPISEPLLHFVAKYTFILNDAHREELVGLSGLEPPTSPLSGVRSNHLSYKPLIKVFLLVTFPSDNLCEHFTQSISLGKEVIQPQVPLRLPCYDFTPVMNHKVVSALPKVKLPTSFATHSHGVTGGVYKARERIHRSILIYDY